MKNVFPKIALIAVFALCANACERPPSKTKAQVMQERLDERLDRWRESLLNRCRQDVLDAATVIVDSTLLANARQNRDVSGLPDIPGRPNRPGFETPKDSTPVAPLLRFIQDSLLTDLLLLDSLRRDSIVVDSIR